MAKERLQKIMASAGVASRRACEEMIRKGRVTIDGHPAEIGMKADARRNIIAVDGVRIPTPKEVVKRYVMVNKPRGYVTTMSDEMDRKCVADLVYQYKERLYPVGRLDRNSEGLVLMTNDGELAKELTHPSSHIAKVYRVTVNPEASDEQLASLAAGVVLDDGYKTAPAVVRVLDKTPGRAVLEFVLYEGKNRQIRRMCEAVGLEVARLKRLSIGPVRLGMLPPGHTRDLKSEEIRALRNALRQKKGSEK